MMKSVSLGLMMLVSAAGILPALAENSLYLDTALADGYQIKGQSSVMYHKEVDGVDTQFSRVEVLVQKGKVFALCAIETNLDKSTASERSCSTFK